MIDAFAGHAQHRPFGAPLLLPSSNAGAPIRGPFSTRSHVAILIRRAGETGWDDHCNLHRPRRPRLGAGQAAPGFTAKLSYRGRAAPPDRPSPVMPTKVRHLTRRARLGTRSRRALRPFPGNAEAARSNHVPARATTTALTTWWDLQLLRLLLDKSMSSASCAISRARLC